MFQIFYFQSVSIAKTILQIVLNPKRVEKGVACGKIDKGSLPNDCTSAAIVSPCINFVCYAVDAAIDFYFYYFCDNAVKSQKKLISSFVKNLVRKIKEFLYLRCLKSIAVFSRRQLHESRMNPTSKQLKNICWLPFLGIIRLNCHCVA